MLTTRVTCLGCAQENESDQDYEGPNQEDGEEDGYICAVAEPHTAEQQDRDETYEINYEEPSSAGIMKPPRHPRTAKLQDRGNRKQP